MQIADAFKTMQLSLLFLNSDSIGIFGDDSEQNDYKWKPVKMRFIITLGGSEPILVIIINILHFSQLHRTYRYIISIIKKHIIRNLND